MVDKTAVKTLEELKAEIRTLDSKLSLVAQKLKTMEQNQEVIGRTIVVHNEKLRELVEGGGEEGEKPSAGGANPELEKRIVELEKQARELKYVLENINPLEFVTIEQVKDLLAEKLKK